MTKAQMTKTQMTKQIQMTKGFSRHLPELLGKDGEAETIVVKEQQLEGANLSCGRHSDF